MEGMTLFEPSSVLTVKQSRGPLGGGVCGEGLLQSAKENEEIISGFEFLNFLGSLGQDIWQILHKC